MIKTLSQSGTFVQVNSYSPTHIYGSGQSAGQVRYNTTSQQMEVYDGNNWLNISTTASVGLSWEAEEAIRWAQTKMAEESALKARLDKHPGLKDAYEKFQIMDILCKEEDAA